MEIHLELVIGCSHMFDVTRGVEGGKKNREGQDGSPGYE